VTSFIALALRLICAAVFLLAASMKLSNPQSFTESIVGFGFLPDHLTVLATFVVPWMEVVTGLLLLTGLWTRSAAFVYCLLIAAFWVLIYWALDQGKSVDCGCFGKLKAFCPKGIGTCNLIQNGVLFGIGLLSLIMGSGKFGLDSVFRRARAAPPDAA